ncbi:hypothetical protein [Streptomyces sp. MST-110588]|uniref:hypothetical protein n=1 Tax=Streptomyces sp. MST-110588 TaxID=2833628 RepID=UPI001F5D89D3|nr:hypothetical protein [Streptomyces sp. MST-110588]UNO43194.1 hypothetical protein KGS77_31500 [Streptomyces sp. MST-110588]
MELFLEPYGSDHWLVPGETFVVWTVGSVGGDGPWSGTTRGNEPFEADYRPGSATVHANGVHSHVTDEDGNEIDRGHRRPDATGPSA